MKKQTKCPLSGCSQIQTERAHPYFYKNLSSLRLKCRNAEHGCAQEIAYEVYEKHLLECPYQLVSCENSQSGCQFRAISKLMPEHAAGCQYATRKCRWCRQNFLLQHLGAHEESLCDLIEFECRYAGCGARLTKTMLQIHEMDCECRPQAC